MKPLQLARRPAGPRPIRCCQTPPPHPSVTALVARPRHSVNPRASQRDVLGEAPPLDAPPPPPPPPPSSGGQNPFPTRRDLALFMIGGTGLWYWQAEKTYGPNVTYLKEESKATGITIMRSAAGEKFGIYFVNAPNGKRHMVMLDSHGVMWYDPEDRDLGIFVVVPDRTMYNAYPSPTQKGAINFNRVGNLNDVKQITLDGIGDVNLGKEGQVFWAFEDSRPLQINPQALLQRQPSGKSKGLGWPAEVDEGTVKALVKDRNPLRSLFGDQAPGTLQRQ